MNEKHITRSQLGGQSSITGFTYQRDFIALLCARMICNKSENITKMICEYKNDIEIMFGNELTSWQIKSTTGNSVRPEEVYSSIRLFNFLKDTDKYSRFVLVSNRNFTRHDMKPLACYGLDHFLDLKSKIQRKFDGKLEENFLTKIKFMKGPEPDSIRSIISQQLSCLPNKKLLLEDLIFFIDNIWIGLKGCYRWIVIDEK
jgi:Cap4 dsDNA endonuclease